MGNYISFTRATGESEVRNLDASQTYRFPPKSGSYFADHFYLAGEKFENMNADVFLFGENSDLNYLRNKPSNYPFPSPNGDEPSNALRSLVHLRKDSLKIVKLEDDSEDGDSYIVEFIFDSDVDCAVKLFMLAREDIADGVVRYNTKKRGLTSEPIHFPKGAKQKFSSRNFPIQPGKFQPSELSYIPGEGDIPLVIQLTVEHPDFVGQSESTFVGIENLSDGGCSLKFMKQKLMIDGLCLIAQEIYGIENYSNNSTDTDMADNDMVNRNAECTICFSNPRDTLTLPCRHLHLCKECADNIRSTENSCPICKTSFNALLHVKAVRKKDSSDSRATGQYEEIELIDAMTGNLDELAKSSNEGSGFLRRGSSARSRRSSRSKSLAKIRSEQMMAKKTQAAADRTSQKVAVSVESAIPSGAAVDTTDSVDTASTTDQLQNAIDKNKKHSLKKHSIFVEPVADGETKPRATTDHIDPSIPGTPISSDKSSDISASPTALLLNTSQRSSLSSSIIIDTPSNVIYETKINGIENEATTEAEEKD